MGKSGGLLAYGFREGFRSEYLANYIFSAFGPSLPVVREDDYGIDLICSLAFQEGVYMKVGGTFGVQIKCEGKDFKYRGKQATDWLFSLEFPLFFAEVSKLESRIKIYTMWNINRFLLSLEKGNQETYPEEIFFKPTQDDELKSPEKDTGVIPLGHPILDFNIMEIGEKPIKEKYQKILNEWLEFEIENYSYRRAGVSRVFGYIKWETNKSLDEGFRTWSRPYFYSPAHSERAKKLIFESSIIEVIYLKESYKTNQSPDLKAEFNNLRKYIKTHCKEHMDKWSQDIFMDEL